MFKVICVLVVVGVLFVFFVSVNVFWAWYLVFSYFFLSIWRLVRLRWVEGLDLLSSKVFLNSCCFCFSNCVCCVVVFLGNWVVICLSWFFRFSLMGKM